MILGECERGASTGRTRIADLLLFAKIGSFQMTVFGMPVCQSEQKPNFKIFLFNHMTASWCGLFLHTLATLPPAHAMPFAPGAP